MPVLTINHLSKSYGRVKALNDLNITIEAGNIYGLLGPNGSGKTTTLGIILGILKQDSGDFEWFDGCLLYTSPSPRDRTRSRMPSSA